jgi:hypothetical protein
MNHALGGEAWFKKKFFKGLQKKKLSSFATRKMIGCQKKKDAIGGATKGWTQRKATVSTSRERRERWKEKQGYIPKRPTSFLAHCGTRGRAHSTHR